MIKHKCLGGKILANDTIAEMGKLPGLSTTEAILRAMIRRDEFNLKSVRRYNMDMAVYFARRRIVHWANGNVLASRPPEPQVMQSFAKYDLYRAHPDPVDGAGIRHFHVDYMARETLPTTLRWRCTFGNALESGMFCTLRLPFSIPPQPPSPFLLPSPYLLPADSRLIRVLKNFFLTYSPRFKCFGNKRVVRPFLHIHTRWAEVNKVRGFVVTTDISIRTRWYEFFNLSRAIAFSEIFDVFHLLEPAGRIRNLPIQARFVHLLAEDGTPRNDTYFVSVDFTSAMINKFPDVWSQMMSVESSISVAFDTKVANLEYFNDKKDQLARKGVVVPPDRITQPKKVLLKVHRSKDLDDNTSALDELHLEQVENGSAQRRAQETLRDGFRHVSKMNVVLGDSVLTAQTGEIYLKIHADQPVAKRRVSAMARIHPNAGISVRVKYKAKRQQNMKPRPGGDRYVDQDDDIAWSDCVDSDVDNDDDDEEDYPSHFGRPQASSMVTPTPTSDQAHTMVDPAFGQHGQATPSKEQLALIEEAGISSVQREVFQG